MFFGLESGASACQMVTDCVTHLIATAGHWTCIYLDDIIRVANPRTASSVFLSLKNLIEFLGVPINFQKVASTTEEVTCLGANVNARSGLQLPVTNELTSSTSTVSGRLGHTQCKRLSRDS